MKKFVFILILVIGAGTSNVFADAIDDAKDVLNILSQYGNNPKTFNDASMLSVVTKHNAAHRFSNPWNEDTNPDEFAAWPTDIERATFFLQKITGEIASDIGRVAAKEHAAEAAAAKKAKVKAAQDEL